MIVIETNVLEEIVIPDFWDAVDGTPTIWTTGTYSLYDPATWL